MQKGKAQNKKTIRSASEIVLQSSTYQ